MSATMGPEEEAAVGKKIFESLKAKLRPICTGSTGSSMKGGSKPIRNRNRIRSRHSRRPRSIQRGGAMNQWASCAYDSLVREQRDTTLCFYQLIVFIDIVRLLGIENQFNDAQCRTIVDIIRANLTDAHILSAYFQSFLTTITTSDVLEGMAVTTTGAYFGYNYGPDLVEGLASIVQGSPVGYLKDGLIACATSFVQYLTSVSSSGAILIGVCIHSCFYPSGEDLPSLPKEFYDITDFQEAATQLFKHVGRVAGVAAKNKFIQTKEFFKSIFMRVASGIKFTVWSVNTARKYYLTTGVKGAATDACAELTARTLNTIHDGKPITIARLAQLSSNLTAILTQIGEQISEFGVKVNEALKIGKIDCTDADIRGALAVERPLCRPVSGALISTVERMAALDAKANQRQQELLESASSPEPVLRAAAAPAQAVPWGVSYTPPPVVPSGPNSFSVPPQQQLQQPQQSYWGNMDSGRIRRLKRGINSNDDDNHPSSKFSKTTTNGGSSKHKKKHTRSTNKRKLLVKRVRRRRSMKNKNKGKW